MFVKVSRARLFNYGIIFTPRSLNLSHLPLKFVETRELAYYELKRTVVFHFFGTTCKGFHGEEQAELVYADRRGIAKSYAEQGQSESPRFYRRPSTQPRMMVMTKSKMANHQGQCEGTKPVDEPNDCA
ncbi:MAG: hypothetical protein KDA67_16240 [Rhodobacteraceae bacterium]|nr:hypothetical protein [Paracoccaceae bacterium]